MLRRLSFAVGIFLLPALSGWAGKTSSAGFRTGITDAYEIAKSFQLQPLPAAPSWSEETEPPLFSFVWMSDMHLQPGTRMNQAEVAVKYACRELTPDFLVITGDNCGYAPDNIPGTKGRETRADVRRQQAFKAFLERTCTVPSMVIPGDNWPWGFEEVFGAFQYSFDVCGMHFVFLSPDRSATGVEGSAVLAEDTWKWLVRDLTDAAPRPVLVFTHETVLPPSFLDASRLRTLLAKYPNVLGVLSGHLHLDLDLTAGTLRQLVCPSVGMSTGNGFKRVRVYRDRLVFTTYETMPGASYAQASKWQKIDIPVQWRLSAARPGTAVQVQNRRELPPHVREIDQALRARQPELFSGLFMFLMEMGVKGMLSGGGIPAPGTP